MLGIIDAIPKIPTFLTNPIFLILGYLVMLTTTVFFNRFAKRFSLLTFWLFMQSAIAQQPAAPTTTSPIAPASGLENSLPPPPNIDATSYILIDFNSGQVLTALHETAQTEPASLTKLMTAYLVFEKLKQGAIKLDDQVRISEKAWKMVGSRMYVNVNTNVQVEDLLKGMIIQSGNDATVALAEYIGGSEEHFVQLMNEKAQQLGMKSTHFQNSTGLTDLNHYSTAQDLAKIAHALIRTFPEYYRWYSEKEFSYNNITQTNRNLLLWRDKSVDGMKTGFTDFAGYCLISSAKRGEMRLVSVLLGAKGMNERATESEKLLDYGFRFFESYQLYSAKTKLGTAKVWKGEQTEVAFGVSAPIFVTIPRGQIKQLNATVNLKHPLIAPLNTEQAIGTVNLMFNQHSLAEYPLITLNAVETGAFWSRSLDAFWLLFE